jgi:hypothetical protein
MVRRRLAATLKAAGVPPDDVRLYRIKRAGQWGYYGALSTFHAIVKGGVPPGCGRWLPVAWMDGGRPITDFFPISMVTGVWFETLWATSCGTPWPCS